jgi:hypothetical protein
VAHSLASPSHLAQDLAQAAPVHCAWSMPRFELWHADGCRSLTTAPTMFPRVLVVSLLAVSIPRLTCLPLALCRP